MSPSSISTVKSPPPADTSMAIVAFDNSTTHYSSSSPSPPHALSESDEEERRSSRRSKTPVKEEPFASMAHQTPSPIVVVHNPSVKEFVPPPVATTRKSARVGSGRRTGGGGQRSGAVLAILKRSKREEVVKYSALGFRLSEVVLALISFSVMAADKTKGWSGDSFDRYREYRFCLSVNVVAFVYSAFQACDLAYHALGFPLTAAQLQRKWRNPPTQPSTSGNKSPSLASSDSEHEIDEVESQPWYGGSGSASGGYYTTFPPDDDDAEASAPTYYP